MDRRAGGARADLFRRVLSRGRSTNFRVWGESVSAKRGLLIVRQSLPRRRTRFGRTAVRSGPRQDRPVPGERLLQPRLKGYDRLIAQKASGFFQVGQGMLDVSAVLRTLQNQQFCGSVVVEMAHMHANWPDEDKAVGESIVWLTSKLKEQG